MNFKFLQRMRFSRFLIVELLSKSTQKVDKTTKKELYQNTFRTPEYFWFHPETLEFQGFRLMSSKYQAIESTDEGCLWSEQLELFLGINDRKLRYFTQDKQLVVTPEERAKVAQQQALEARQQLEQEQKQKEIAQQRVKELLSKLKDLGVDEQ
ncbi:MAG: Uma2 family endonuclease [Cyanobacteria bacterium P01_H01_bin.150]